MTGFVEEHRRPGAANGVRRRVLDLIALLHRWAESGWANSAAGSWALLQSSVVPGPSEALLLPLGLADPRRAFGLAFWTIVGAMAGGFAAYAIGALAIGGAATPLAHWAGADAAVAAARGAFERYGWMMVVMGSLPVFGSAKIAAYAAGAFALPLPQFALALLVGRVARFALVALLLRFAGERVLDWVRRRTGRPVERISSPVRSVP